jgi:hypothetical protein
MVTGLSWTGGLPMSLPRHLMLLGALSLATLAGCYNPCAHLEVAYSGCGQTFDRAKCDSAVGGCSEDDVRTIQSTANCLENDAVCSNGTVNDGFKVAACVIPLASMSNSCRQGF